MKTRITIETDNYINPDEILNQIRSIEGVKRVEVENDFPMEANEEAVAYETKPLQTAYRPGLPTTHEELLEDLHCALEDAKAGRVITQEELEKEIMTWGKR